MKRQIKLVSPVGELYLVASAEALEGIFWSEQIVPEADLNDGTSCSAILQTACDQLTEYFEGKRTGFNLPLSAQGTKFQKSVWAQLERIPYGETRSYKDIAQALNDSNACRAVGAANGKNPLSIVVPCHRVINAGGGIGGYAGGLDIKTKLLRLEGSL